MCVYMCEIYINSFQTLDIKQCRAVIPERGKTNGLSPVIAPAGAWRDSRLHLREGTPQQSPEVSLSSGNRSVSPERQKWLKLVGQNLRARSKMSRKKEQRVKRIPLRLKLNTSLCMEETIEVGERTTRKEQRKQSLKFTQGNEQFVFLLGRVENFINKRALVRRV